MKAKTDTRLFDAYGKAFEFSFQKQKTQEFTKNNELLCFYIRAKNRVFSQTLLAIQLNSTFIGKSYRLVFAYSFLQVPFH